jgi:hypothetical protein
LRAEIALAVRAEMSQLYGDESTPEQVEEAIVERVYELMEEQRGAYTRIPSTQVTEDTAAPWVKVKKEGAE